MKFILTAFLVAVATCGFSTAAHAVAGTAEFMDYVAETEVPNQTSGKQLSLCHLIEKWHVFFVPVYYSSKGYVLATDRCDTDRYAYLDEGDLGQMKAAELIPGSVPQTPSLSKLQFVTPFIWAVVIIGGIFIRSGKVRGQTPQGRAVAADYMTRVLEVACRAALADGKIEDREIGAICGIASQFTSDPVHPDKMRDMVDYVRSQPETADYTALGQGLDEFERNQLMRVALTVIGPENANDGADKAFLDRLGMGLLIDQERRTALAKAL